MAYIANRNMNLGFKEFERGEVIPTDKLHLIPDIRFGRMLRTQLILEVPDEEVGEVCDVCGEGPFQRVARHKTAKHDVDTSILDDPVDIQMEEASLPSEEALAEAASEEE